jgi:threonine dehydrogenase-like Zn-dependent dehydrogenase
MNDARSTVDAPTSGNTGSRSLSGSMHAVVRRGSAAAGESPRVEFGSIARPTTSPSSALVRVTTALLTPLEREVARGLGTDAAGPRVLGTSLVGVVEDPSAASSSGLARGTRVAVHPVVSCGVCERCHGGLALHCAARTILGFDDACGGLAEFVAVPSANLVALPKELDDDRAVFAVSLARAMQAVRRGGVEGKTFASVLGDDLIAILAAVVAVEENPLARLVAVHESTLRIAEQFGIRHRALQETGRRGDQELVIDTAGSAETLLAAARMVRPRGHVIAAGVSARATVAVELSHIALDEIELRGAGFGPLAGAIDRLARRVIDPSPLVSRRIALQDVPRAIPNLAEPGTFAMLVQVSR